MTLSTLVTPPDIAKDYPAWLAWKSDRRAEYYVNCPLARTTTYYFSKSGDDTTGDGSEGNPWETIVKAVAQLSSGSNDIRLRFNRGDMWRETTGLFVTGADDYTVDDYGSGNLPFFNRFIVRYLAADDDWTLAAGDRYTVTETASIAWIRLETDRLGETRGTALIRQDSAANCESTDNSFFIDDAGNVLHINLAGDNPNDFDLEAVIDNTDSGVKFDGDGGRCENIRADGWGINILDAATQEQPFTNKSSGSEANLFVGCEGYFSATHVMAHNLTGTGGLSYWENCKAGFGSLSGLSVYNSYSSAGGNETWFDGCEASYGLLKNYFWSYTTEIASGQAFQCHTNTNTVGLMVLSNCILRGNHTSCKVLIGFKNSVTISTEDDLTDCRAFAVKCVHEKPLTAIEPSMVEMQDNSVFYGNTFNLFPLSGGIASFYNARRVAWYSINDRYEIDLSAIGNNLFGFYNGASGTAEVHFIHSYFRWYNAVMTSNNRFALDFDIRGPITPVGSGTSSNSRMINTIIVMENTGGTGVHLGLTNVSTKIKNNAYFGLTQDVNDERGYDNDAGLVDLSATLAYGVSHVDIVGQGTTDYLLSHDANGKLRRRLTPDIGPIDFSFVRGYGLNSGIGINI